ncbi:PIF-6 [Tipula oleracea nudivirus]|uniref:PIF-6 n=1 Tax=Tipula oleracea nudivirus TaxID=1546257 RepID=A0A0B4VG69_9VIRU|nr:PIF-6 [Tipula oleracea nudivirus]AJD20116.1 PIF-6 [Tipula oleracea nudivirus]
MKISQEFINNLWFKGGWQLETINEQTFSTISNPILCRLFWLQYWKEILLPAFQNQKHIKILDEVDLTTKVIVDTVNGNLLSTPPSWVNIFYYGDYIKEDIREPLFLVNNNTLTITIFIIIVIIIINVIVLFIPSKNQKLIELI